jgi:uncharacterized C2H2 Zn-finger protein
MDNGDIWRCPKCNAAVKNDKLSRIEHIGKCIGFKTINRDVDKKE